MLDTKQKICRPTPQAKSYPPGPQARTANAAALECELAWLATVIETSIQLYFCQECKYQDVRDIVPPDLSTCASPYAQLVYEDGLSFEERVVLMLALAPHVRPQVLDLFLTKNTNFDRGFTEFGGILAGNHGGFWPTLETAAFVLAGTDLQPRFAQQALFDPDHVFRNRKILELDDASTTQSLFSAPLQLGKEYLTAFTTGANYKPNFSTSFPAKRLTTLQDWDDLVLADRILDEVAEIKAWIEHRHTLLHTWQLNKKIKPGFRSLFYGPPGTGKTFTASLLGKTTGLDVYRVDPSLVVSKWAGETEKNLASVFDQAETNDWILFFDEADALFGKRTQTASAHDRYANQEVSYLLQRVEDFPGVVILATNLKGNIDETFARRFQSMIYFPTPGPEERLRLWRNTFPKQSRLEASVDLEHLADEFEMTGGAIMNVLRYASLMALRCGSDVVRLQDMRNGIRRELRKDGKVV